MGSGVIVAKRMVASRCGEALLGKEDPLSGAELELHPINRRGRTRHSDENDLMYTTYIYTTISFVAERYLPLWSSREEPRGWSLPTLLNLRSPSLMLPRHVPTPRRIRGICICTSGAPCAHLTAELDRRPTWGSSGKVTSSVDMDSDLRGHSGAKIHPRITDRIRTGGAGPDDRRRIGRPGLVIQRVQIARPSRSAEIIRGHERREKHRPSKHNGIGHRPLCRRAGR